LRQEFYPFFPRVLTVLTDLINPREPEALEAVFTCISFLFKFLAKQLVDELPEVFRYVIPQSLRQYVYQPEYV
jgi:U3 small nucleolar RNA-associated protein 20